MADPRSSGHPRDRATRQLRSRRDEPGLVPARIGDRWDVLGNATVAPREGAGKIGVLASDFGPAGGSLLSLIEDGLALTTASGGPVVRVPLGVDNLEPYVSAATAGDVDGLVVFVASDDPVAAFEALDAAHFEGKVVTPASLVEPVLSSNETTVDGTLLVGEFPPLTARLSGMRQFREDMLDHDVKLAFETDEGALNFWLAAWVFQRVAATVPRIDAASMLQAMANLERLDMGGLTPPLTTAVPSTSYPRLFNSTVTLGRVEQGEVQWIGKRFFDPLSAQLR